GQNQIELYVRQLNSEGAPLCLPLPLVVLLEEWLELVHRLGRRELILGELGNDDDVHVRSSIVLRPNRGCPSKASLEEVGDEYRLQLLVSVQPITKCFVTGLEIAPLVLRWAYLTEEGCKI